jgi:hypothetical protein
MEEAQHLIEVVIAALRDARASNREGKLMIAFSYMAPRNTPDPMIWGKVVLTVLDGGENSESILRAVIRESTVESLEAALRVLRRPED